MDNSAVLVKNNLLRTPRPDELYIITEHWKSDLKFFSEELKFLEDLISKYLILLAKEEGIEKVQNMVSSIEQLITRSNAISILINKHLHIISEVIRNTPTSGNEKFIQDHSIIEESVTSFYKDFMHIKKEAFTLTQNGIRSEKLKSLLYS